MSIVNNTGKRFMGMDFPYLLFGWKEMFNPESMPADIWAGLTVVLVALPLNLALAIASGVEPGIGVTTAIVSSIIVSFLEGQKYTITGPTAAMAVVLIEIAQTYGMAAIWLVGIMAGSMQRFGWDMSARQTNCFYTESCSSRFYERYRAFGYF